MNELEQQVADEIYQAIQDYSNKSVRSQQADRYQVGVSDLGWCSERTRRMLNHEDPDDTDVLAAFLGTAIGDHAERAIERNWPDTILQAEVELVLHGEQGRNYHVPGHPDIVRTEAGWMLDGKTAYGLANAERNGASQQQRFQRHGYGIAAYNAGLFSPKIEVSDIVVGNFWIDRAGKDKRVHVEMEPLDLEVVEEAGRWLDDVIYAFLNKMEARKEPPREVCAVACGFFNECRLYDTDVQGLITDPELVDFVNMYVEGRDMEREGKRLKDQAKVGLSEISGATQEFLVRHTWVNEAVLQGYVRKGYDKLDIRKRTVK